MMRAVVVTILLVGALVFVFLKGFNSSASDTYAESSKRDNGFREVQYESDYHASHSDFQEPIAERNYLPKDDAEVIYHNYYTLGYNEPYEQASWVAYKLTKASLLEPNVKRAKNFRYDKSIKSYSAVHKDYSHSGYTRGHLAPAGDMAFNTTAMNESFLMSNMSPQIRPFNNGVWKELEENVRDWAFSNQELYVVSGPVFYDDNPEFIGQRNKIAVPDAFYKILIDNYGADKKAVAFLIPHEKTDTHLRDFAVSIDEVERVTGIDFFSTFFESDQDEEKMESTFNVKRWKISEKRYKQRVNNWNKE